MAASTTLDRFKTAQDDVQAGFATALGELRGGRKSSHWIWYVFPQLASLGRSSTARFYGIRDLQEACDYLLDPILRERLVRVTRVVDEQLAGGASVTELMGGATDSLKLASSLTLFQRAANTLADANPSLGLLEFGQSCDRILAQTSCQGFPRCAQTEAEIGL